jgi:hypothetical protein
MIAANTSIIFGNWLTGILWLRILGSDIYCPWKGKGMRGIDEYSHYCQWR